MNKAWGALFLSAVMAINFFLGLLIGKMITAIVTGLTHLSRALGLS